MANMVAAFFGRAADGKDIFERLKIAEYEYYREYLNQYDVIYIDFSRLPRDCKCYEQYISRIQNGINHDLMAAYPEQKLDENGAVWDSFQAVFEQKKNRFVFVMDEWDAIFHKSFITDADKKSYLEFLRDLLKGQAYVEFAYMTGVLPIAKYSSGSEMNMFKEYDMATKGKFSEHFGFLDSEVDLLFEIYQKTTRTMSAILKMVHDTESPIFSYNSEIELSAIVNLIYLSARDKYRVEREDKAGEGYVDFIFYPERKGADALVLELKVDSTPEEAIRQIKDRNYALRFKGKIGEKPKYTGKILAVGISYDRKTKEHSCKVEVIG